MFWTMYSTWLAWVDGAMHGRTEKIRCVFLRALFAWNKTALLQVAHHLSLAIFKTQAH